MLQKPTAFVLSAILGLLSVGITPIVQAAEPTATGGLKNTVQGESGSTTVDCILNDPYLEVDITLSSSIGPITAYGGVVIISGAETQSIPFSGINVPPVTPSYASVQVALDEPTAGERYTARVSGGGTTFGGPFVIGGKPTDTDDNDELNVLPSCSVTIPFTEEDTQE